MRTSIYVKLIGLLALGGMTMGCLPDKFWVNKWGEIVNRSIFGVINLLLFNTTDGTVVI